MSAVTGMLTAMRAAGIQPTYPGDTGDIVADGVLHRFRCDGDKPGTLNGWFVLHPDHGAAGSWKSGASCAWSSKATTKMTKAEKDALCAAIRQAKAEAQRQREADHQAAADRASMLWSKAAPATADHPYIVRKRIPPGPARQSGELLVLKIEDVNGNTKSLQYISEGGTKRMLSGGAKRAHFILVAGALPADVIVIAEGFATASTVATQFPDACTLASIDAGNLEPVALAIRAKFPAAEIVIAADDDRLTPGNPGLTKARAAAAAVRRKLVRPVWPEGAPESLTDFTDLALFLQQGGTMTAGADTPAGDNSRCEVVNVVMSCSVPQQALPMAEEAPDPKEDPKEDADEKEEERGSQASALVKFVQERAELFHDENKDVFAKDTDTGEVRRIDGRQFRDWLQASFYQATEKSARDQSVREAISTLSGLGRFKGECLPVSVRVGLHEGAYYLDLATPGQSRAVKIEPGCWEIVDNPPIMFLRTESMRPLPEPVHGGGGDLSALWKLVNIPEDARLLVLAWLAESLRPDTPFPVLELIGEQGSARVYGNPARRYAWRTARLTTSAATGSSTGATCRTKTRRLVVWGRSDRT